MERLIVGAFTFITKIHLLNLKQQLTHPYTYHRDDFDHIIITYDQRTKIKIAQDGLIYVDTTDKTRTPEAWFKVLKEEVLKKIITLDEEDSFFKQLLLQKKPAVIILTDKSGKEAFKTYNREKDYSIQTPFVNKHYGQGLVVYEKLRLKGRKREQLIETQLLLADYQEIVKHLLSHNQTIWKNVGNIRKKEQFKFKEIPTIIDELLEKKRITTTVTKSIQQLGDFIKHRQEKCFIKKELDALKLNDFDEMIKLNSYLRDQYDMTNEHIKSTMDLTEYIYKENEQKELNILQVIFAIGTIATVVSLGAMPGAKLFLKITGNEVTGDIVSFSSNDLIFWTIVSIIIGTVLFILLNYFFLSAKKLRIVNLIKKKK